MTIPNDSSINCELFADALPDLLEREVDETTRARLESHALSCAECGPLLADLRKLRIDAANLPELTPSRDLWAGIAERIETPVVEIMPGGGRTVERWTGGTVERAPRRLSPLWMGLAAAGLVAVTATVTYQLTKSPISVTAFTQPVSQAPAVQPGSVPAAPTPVVASVPAQPDSVQPVNRSTVPPATATLVSTKSAAEQTYDAEIKRLRLIVAARRTSLDTTTINVIERNLTVIDEAIAQCRAALKRDPASAFLLESLNDALDTKVQLLRTAAMLPSRT